jgi:hypothetical protein
MKDFGSKLGKLGRFCFTAAATIANPTQHDLHGPDDAQTTIDYHHLDPSRDDGMDEQEMIHRHFGCPDEGFWLEVGQTAGRFCLTATIANPTQHDLHGPDDAQTTIDDHHLDPSRDDGMDEQEIHWHFGC